MGQGILYILSPQTGNQCRSALSSLQPWNLVSETSKTLKTSLKYSGLLPHEVLSKDFCLTYFPASCPGVCKEGQRGPVVCVSLRSSAELSLHKAKWLAPHHLCDMASAAHLPLPHSCTPASFDYPYVTALHRIVLEYGNLSKVAAHSLLFSCVRVLGHYLSCSVHLQMVRGRARDEPGG